MKLHKALLELVGPPTNGKYLDSRQPSNLAYVVILCPPSPW